MKGNNMSNFKISPLMQEKTRIKKRPCFRLLLLIIVLETMAFGYWIFRLNTKITELKQQINTMRTMENEEEQANVQQ
jgi:hypothetical protein